MNDRYDEVMLALYTGTTPPWIPKGQRALFQRESLRRRCALGQSLAEKFSCSLYYARSTYGVEITEEIFSAWPAMRHRAVNVLTGLYLAADAVIGAADSHGPVRALLHYEALAVAELVCPLNVPTVPAPDSHSALLSEATIFAFEFDTPAIHARLMLYAGGGAPSTFARAFDAPRRATRVARVATSRGFALQDVTHLYQADEGDAHDAADLH